MLALVPPHHGLVIDKASADPVAIQAGEVDQLRPRPIPFGTEADVVFHLPPPHVVDYLAGIRRVGKPAGAGRITATWTLFPDSVPALLLIVKPARNADGPAALDAVYRAVQDLAPPEAVRVIDAGTLSRGQMFRTLSGQRLVESPAPDPDPYAVWPASGPGTDPRLRRRTDPGAGASAGAGSGSGGGGGPANGTGNGTGKRPINGRTPFNLALAMFGSVFGAFVATLPRQFSLSSSAGLPVVIVGVLIIVLFVGLALYDFFRREP
ncbi:hypothetical protein ACFQ9X_02765 [Catenulispora yoronensis]